MARLGDELYMASSQELGAIDFGVARVVRTMKDAPCWRGDAGLLQLSEILYWHAAWLIISKARRAYDISYFAVVVILLCRVTKHRRQFYGLALCI